MQPTTLPPEPPTHSFAATDIYPRAQKELELCERASSTDWIYLGSLILADVGSLYVDSTVKYNKSLGVRLVGPSLVGLSWGATLGGGYLAIPKCRLHWVSSAPPEGDVRTTWPVALAFALMSAATAPFLVGIETGPLPGDWELSERSGRLALAGVMGFIGALIPYAIPPKTWRAAKELQRIRAEATATGGFLSYAVVF